MKQTQVAAKPQGGKTNETKKQSNTNKTMTNTKTNGQASTGEVKAVNNNPVVTETPQAKVDLLNVKKSRIHDLEGFCKQSLDKIGIFKLLEGYDQQISELSNILKESSSEVKVVIYDEKQERLRVSKPDVIEDVLKLLRERNNVFMSQLVDEIVE